MSFLPEETTWFTAWNSFRIFGKKISASQILHDLENPSKDLRYRRGLKNAFYCDYPVLYRCSPEEIVRVQAELIRQKGKHSKADEYVASFASAPTTRLLHSLLQRAVKEGATFVQIGSPRIPDCAENALIQSSLPDPKSPEEIERKLVLEKIYSMGVPQLPESPEACPITSDAVQLPHSWMWLPKNLLDPLLEQIRILETVGMEVWRELYPQSMLPKSFKVELEDSGDVVLHVS